MQTLDDEHPVLDLSAEECWALLRTQELGRVAYRLVDEVHIVPINYLVDRGRLIVRTASGNKLLAAALHSDAALEIDCVEETTAWSVVARGRFHRLSEDEQAELDDSRLHSWVPTPKYETLALLPAEVTGRGFLLRR
jgi:hypothetical protein